MIPGNVALVLEQPCQTVWQEFLTPEPPPKEVVKTPPG